MTTNKQEAYNVIIVNGVQLTKEQTEIIEGALDYYKDVGEGYANETNSDIEIIEAIENLLK